MKSARLSVTLPGRNEVLSDATFPFEFSLPLKAGEDKLSLTVEATLREGSNQKT